MQYKKNIKIIAEFLHLTISNVIYFFLNANLSEFRHHNIVMCNIKKYINFIFDIFKDKLSVSIR